MSVIVNKTAKNISIQVFLWICVFISLRYVCKNIYCWVLLGVCLTLLETTKQFSKVILPFYTSINKSWVFQFFHILTNTWYHRLLILAILMYRNGEFSLDFPDDSWCWSPFHVCHSNFGKWLSFKILNILSFMGYAFGVVSKNLSPNPRSPGFSPFYSRSFVVLYFMYSSMTHLELVFMKGVRLIYIIYIYR